MTGRLQDRTIIVTGGSRGIGQAVVKLCMEEGAFVGYTHIHGQKNAMEHGNGAVPFLVDTTDEKGMTDAASELSSMGPGDGIDGLVINAGIYKRAPFREMGIGQWRRTILVNLEGAFTAVRACLPYMDKGAIVMVSSQLAFRGSEHGADYAASKSGLLGLARSLAKELAPDIRVNTVSPGYVDTDILAGDTMKKRSWRTREVPLGRIALPREIAAPIVFLLSDDSSYVTGADLDINGGLYIH
ncbi:MAG: SDR family NAD(P)-dependent oxidoreductase [Thermoplasmatota archaeon]